ncbi:hypothetical protein BGZ98_004146 [Dissophora globulifera]|nr:hypothetical protein BGZ98_004146 [Dissophora globulifera]
MCILDPMYCRRQVHEGERHVDLELDTNTALLAPIPFQSQFKSSSGHTKSSARNNLIFNWATEVAMAANAEEDERELQNMLSKSSISTAVQGTAGVRTGGGAGGLVLQSGLVLQNGIASEAAVALNPTSLLTIEQQSKVQRLADAFKETEVCKCRLSEIDWVLSMVHELNMLNTPSLEEVADFMSQRAVVGGLVAQAIKVFLGNMPFKAISVHCAEIEAEKGLGSIMIELDALGADDDTEDGSSLSKKGSTKVANNLLAR